MLSESKLQSIILTSGIAESEVFYRDVPGLPLRGRLDGALVMDAGTIPIPYDCREFIAGSGNVSRLKRARQLSEFCPSAREAA